MGCRLGPGSGARLCRDPESLDSGIHTCGDITSLTCLSGRMGPGRAGGWGRICCSPINGPFSPGRLACRARQAGEQGAQLDSSFCGVFAKGSLTAGEKIAPAPLSDHCELQRVLLWAEAEVHSAVKDLKCKKAQSSGVGSGGAATSEEMQAAPGGWRKPWAEKFTLSHQ